MLQLSLHDFYNTVVKTKYKLYTASGSAPPPPPNEKFWARAWKKQPRQRRTFPTSCYFQASDINMKNRKACASDGNICPVQIQSTVSSLIYSSHGHPTCGPAGRIMRPAATFVNYLYTIKITQ
jgi:hypothetical protein